MLPMPSYTSAAAPSHMKAGVVTTLLAASTWTSVTSFSTCCAPHFSMAAAVSAYGQRSLLVALPTVSSTPAMHLAASTGAMQQKPMGFPAWLKSWMTRSTSGCTVKSGWKAKVDKFLATPKPPGKMTASNSLANRRLKLWILPRAMRADSSSTLRCDSGGHSTRVLLWCRMWCRCSMSGAKKDTSAPAFCRWISTDDASMTSLPSNTPQPERTTATRFPPRLSACFTARTAAGRARPNATPPAAHQIS
mmetsp:Transcript_11532/g.36860  ORF Transcript_11532/g.36860 Transcript_11532/m.36860 type:complete len:248 (+) Transcript_11532:65-808(+)